MDKFNYNGFTFEPIRQFNKKENAMDFWTFTSRFLKSDLDNKKHFSKYEGGNYEYSAFYKCANASGAEEIDIFKCKENGKLYVPGANELFIFTGQA